MSVNAVDPTTGNTTPIAGNTNNLVGNLSALTTSTKSDAVGAINELNQTKQNAEVGKGLSTNDFTDTYKDKVDNNTGAIEAIVNEYGAKNLLPNRATSQTLNGVTFTVNTDGSVTVNGTATARIDFNIARQDVDGFHLGSGNYIINGCPADGGSESYHLLMSVNNTWGTKDVGQGVTVNGTIEAVVIRVMSGVKIDNKTFYPMVRDARISDDTYVPYAMTNRELTGAVDQLKSGLTNLDNEVNGDAVEYPYADVITIEDAVPSNLADCNVKIEPVQDLHGYDHPWVGGAGKNKLPLVLADIKAANTSGTWSGNAYTVNGVTFTVQTDSDANVTGIKVNGTVGSGGVAFYIIKNDTVPYNGTFKFTTTNRLGSGVAVLDYIFSDASQHTEVYAQDITKEISSNLTNMSIYLWAGNTFNNVIMQPMMMLSTETDATFAPYTNICPITQYDSCKITRVGKNLFDPINVETFDATGQGVIRYGHRYNNGTYTIVNNMASESIFVRQVKNDLSEYGQYSTINALNHATINVNDGYMLYVYYQSLTEEQRKNVCVNKGNDTTFESYKCNDYQIELNGNTYYGQLRIDTQGNVYFDVDQMYRTFANSDTWQFGIAIDNKYDIFRLSSSIAKNSSSIKSDSFEGVELFGYKNYQLYVTADGKPAISVPINEYNTITLHNLVDNTNFVYKIKEPFTIALKDTPINLVKGQNTIYADTGNIEVTVNNTMDAIGSMQEQVNGLAKQLPNAPTTDGVYTLTVTVADGTPTYSWESAT